MRSSIFRLTASNEEYNRFIFVHLRSWWTSVSPRSWHRAEKHGLSAVPRNTLHPKWSSIAVMISRVRSSNWHYSSCLLHIPYKPVMGFFINIKWPRQWTKTYTFSRDLECLFFLVRWIWTKQWTPSYCCLLFGTLLQKVLTNVLLILLRTYCYSGLLVIGRSHVRTAHGRTAFYRLGFHEDLQHHP